MACCEVKFVECRLSDVDAYQLLLALVKLLKNGQQRGVLGSQAEKLVTQNMWRYNLASLGEVLMMEIRRA